MQFIPLEHSEQLDAIASANTLQVILKHNMDCPISKGVLQRMQASAQEVPGINTIHVLDLHLFRSISNDIATRFDVAHQSPQLLLIKDGKCTYSEWGYDISTEALAEAVTT